MLYMITQSYNLVDRKILKQNKQYQKTIDELKKDKIHIIIIYS